MVLRSFRIAATLALAGLLAGCSVIAGLFPDKQKQYRYSTDLPPLEIPPDLSSGTIEGAKVLERSEPPRPEREAEPEAAAEAEEGKAANRRPAGKPAASLAQNSEDAPLIEIEESFAEAWNDVHRALGRLEVEVTDRNRSEGVFYVNYGGGAKPAKEEDAGLWSDIKSVFTGSEKDGESFRVVVERADKVTNIFVRDDSDKAVTDGLGLELLKKLNDKLKALDDGATAAEGGGAEKER